MKTTRTRLILVILASALCIIGASSCRTFRGFGRDVEHVGSHIEHAAR